jgi:DNA invertase Pin-like site-specific DNA recombinase
MIHKELFKKFIIPKSENIAENRNIVAYTRISSIGQQDNFSLLQQKEEIYAYAKANNYNIIAEFGAKVESASDDMSRKEFKRLYDWVTTEAPLKPFAIAIRFISRFSRSGASAIGIVQELIEKKGIHLIETSTGLCTYNLRERYEIFDKLLKANVENQERLEKTLPGMIKFLKAGNWLGKAPLGYSMRGTRVVDYRLKYFKQDVFIDERGKLIKLAWKWKLEGERDVYIRARLAELGLNVTKGQLSSLWRKPFYCGVIVNSLIDEPVRGHWEPMVSEEDFLRINDMIEAPKRVPYASEVSHIKRPLTRFLKCGECGHRLSGYEVKKKGVHYYKCNKCKGSTFNAETSKKALTEGLNNQFFNLLDQYVLNEVVEPVFKQELRRFFQESKTSALTRIKVLEDEIAQEEAKLRQLDERYWLSNVSISAEKYKGFLDHIRMEKALKEAKLEVERKKVSNLDFYLNEVLAIAREVQYLWASADLETKLVIQKTVFPEGLVIRPLKRTYLTSNINPFFRVIPIFTRVLERRKTKKVTISDDFSSLVAAPSNLSNQIIQGYELVVNLYKYMNRTPD